MPRRTNDELVLQPVTEITGRLSPKSIVASGTGLYFAQNMMYQHTISVFDADKELVATLDDSVDLGAFGYDVAGGVYRGAPVEAVFTSDGSHVFVSNYRMYGPGYDPNAGGDSCGKDRGQQSFVYRIDTTSLEIDRVYEAGPVPKSVAVTPDDRLLLVSNWCGFDVSVIDLQTDETLAEIEVGRYPRGIAVTSEGSTAYVAVMGSTDVAVIDLSAVSSGGTLNGAAGEFDGLSYLQGVGAAPRHLILSPDDEVLYVSLNGEDAVVAIDVDTGLELMRVRTGTKPRSMDISDDGTALYVVNYESNTMTKLRTRDFTELQRFATAHHPIGITYDSFNDEVWVSAYSGVIHVYAERASDEPPCTSADCEADANTEGPAAVDPESGRAEAESEPEGVGLEESARPESATTSPSTVVPTDEAFSEGPLSFEYALRVAEQLASHILVPGDCAPSPLNNPERLPNAARAYRGGTHQGVDFPCSRGHPIGAALDGHVVVAVGDYEDASPQRFNEVLAIAKRLGYTPPHTLMMLYGNHVVVDHGIVDGVGHVISISAHLEALDPEIRIGGLVTAGQLLGRAGNSGTAAAAVGQANGQVHLHWELHVNGQYLGAGLSTSDTRAVYAALFSDATQ